MEGKADGNVAKSTELHRPIRKLELVKPDRD